MKKMYWLALAVFGILLAACSKEEPAAGPDMLIAAIADASGRTEVEPNELPAAINAYVEDVYFDSYIETAFIAPRQGYEVRMGCGDNLFFDLNGSPLDYRGTDPSRFGPDGPHGPCRPADGFGTLIDVANLPTGIQEYLAANYPDYAAVRAKRRGGNIIIALRGPVLLLFDSEGVFLEELTPLHHCHRPCRDIRPANLPTPIVEYVRVNYPDAELRKACARNGRIGLFLINGDSRLILVFDREGNLLFVRG